MGISKGFQEADGKPPIRQLSRTQMLAMLGLTDRQLRYWERTGWIQALPPETAGANRTALLPEGDQTVRQRQPYYRFSDAAALRTVLHLRRSGVSPRLLRSLREAIRGSASDPSRAWNDLQVERHGRGISISHQGLRMEPLTGQFLLDFAPRRSTPVRRMDAPERNRFATPEQRRAQSERLFLAGLRYEEHPETIPKAIRAYQKAIELNPSALGAFLNLGTIYYHRGDHAAAEQNYRAALALNPNSALVHFNLGNLLEEQGRLEQACAHYETAIRMDSSYPDPHFNLALLYERLGRHGRACQQWRQYLKLDATSRWAAFARQKLQQIPLRVVVPSAPRSSS